MTVEDVIRIRAIEEVVHFTTYNRGLAGILAVRAVRPRKRLPEDGNLDFILHTNAAFRKDIAWLDYVNLSISHINSEFFAHSNRWHRERGVWWCIPSFDSVILTHPGVYFTTTNNIYPSAYRGMGGSGLEKLFVAEVAARYGNIVVRPRSLPARFPTCEQAEVLYPGDLSTKFLRKIYVSCGEDADDVHGQLAVLNHTSVEVVVDESKFHSYKD